MPSENTTPDRERFNKCDGCAHLINDTIISPSIYACINCFSQFTPCFACKDGDALDRAQCSTCQSSGYNFMGMPKAELMQPNNKLNLKTIRRSNRRNQALRKRIVEENNIVNGRV